REMHWCASRPPPEPVAARLRLNLPGGWSANVPGGAPATRFRCSFPLVRALGHLTRRCSSRGTPGPSPTDPPTSVHRATESGVLLPTDTAPKDSRVSRRHSPGAVPPARCHCPTRCDQPPGRRASCLFLVEGTGKWRLRGTFQEKDGCYDNLGLKTRP